MTFRRLYVIIDKQVNIITWTEGAFLWGDLDKDQSSKICLDHGTDESTLAMDSKVPLMRHDPDRSWITDPDPDHPKEERTQIFDNVTLRSNLPK